MPALAKVFDDIYLNGRWGAALSSGPGSSMETTLGVRRWLRDLLGDLQTVSLLDVGCGRSTWMRLAVPPTVTRYYGIDVSSVVCAENAKLETPPGWEFALWNMAEAPVPGWFGMAVCRDVMTHLSDKVVLAMLTNIAVSTDFLLATHWPQTKANTDIECGRWRPINLEIQPFCLGAPIRSFKEETVGKAPDGKFLSLFDLRAGLGRSLVYDVK